MATNPLHPTVEIELGDETRVMRMDFNAMAIAEDALGRSLFQIGAILARPKISELTAIVWACLLHGQPELKLAEVRSLIGFHNRVEMHAAIVDLVNRSYPAKDEEAENVDEAAEAPLARTPRRRGKSSGAPADNASD